MPTKQIYNGWWNYETWNCALWLDNDRNYQVMVFNKAKELALHPNGLSLMEDWLKEFVNDGCPELTASMYSDILNAALREINYREIAKSLLDTVLEDIKGDK